MSNKVNPKRGEVWWVSVNPTVGTEIEGKGSNGSRPCVVLSSNVFNNGLRTVVVAPCTTQFKDYPFRPQINSTIKPCQVAVDQMRCFDKSTDRFLKKMCDLTSSELKKCLEAAQALFDS
ncbi:type II toxin-antitoxin system PemK/MazF family toxin [Halobacteriovorax sp. CON-3]|uniref:type II toxin-antitoxin system PemK/MazF family toxin n=1 Tax=Halobacteriovorax sp. CON-3 TaxID=3157710 RepID=UPI0037218464